MKTAEELAREFCAEVSLYDRDAMTIRNLIADVRAGILEDVLEVLSLRGSIEEEDIGLCEARARVLSMVRQAK